MIKSKKPLQAFAKWLFLFVVILLFVHYFTRCSTGHAIWISHDQAVKNLETVIPLLEQYHITTYNNQDWCKNIHYNKGGFSNNHESSACNLFDDKTLSLEGSIKTDFDTIAQAIKQTQVDVMMLDANYDQNSSKITYARFILAIPFNPTYYIYQPNYNIHTLVDITHEMTVTPINKDWYQINDDWN